MGRVFYGCSTSTQRDYTLVILSLVPPSSQNMPADLYLSLSMLEIMLHPIGLATEIKSKIRCRAVKGCIISLRPTEKDGAPTLSHSLFQIAGRSPGRCYMLPHCLCAAVPGVEWWTPRLALKVSCPRKTLGPGKTGMVGHPIRPLSWNKIWNSEAGKRSPWPAQWRPAFPSTPRACLKALIGTCWSAPAASSLGTGKHMPFHLVSPREGKAGVLTDMDATDHPLLM